MARFDTMMIATKGAGGRFIWSDEERSLLDDGISGLRNELDQIGLNLRDRFGHNAQQIGFDRCLGQTEHVYDRRCLQVQLLKNVTVSSGGQAKVLVASSEKVNGFSAAF